MVDKSDAEFLELTVLERSVAANLKIFDDNHNKEVFNNMLDIMKDKLMPLSQYGLQGECFKNYREKYNDFTRHPRYFTATPMRIIQAAYNCTSLTYPRRCADFPSKLKFYNWVNDLINSHKQVILGG